MKIPVFHDDQHGTAIISAAALTNALLLAKKEGAGRTNRDQWRWRRRRGVRESLSPSRYSVGEHYNV